MRIPVRTIGGGPASLLPAARSMGATLAQRILLALLFDGLMRVLERQTRAWQMAGRRLPE